MKRRSFASLSFDFKRGDVSCDSPRKLLSAHMLHLSYMAQLAI